MSSEKYGLHSSCSLILSLQALVTLFRFTAALIGPVFTIAVPGSLIPSKMYNKFSRVFTKDFSFQACANKRGVMLRFIGYFFFLRFP